MLIRLSFYLLNLKGLPAEKKQFTIIFLNLPENGITLSFKLPHTMLRRHLNEINKHFFLRKMRKT